MDFPFIGGTMNVRHRKSIVEIKSIAKCLNDFAETIALYQQLVGKGTSFFKSNPPLDTYSNNTFAVFAKDTPNDVKENTAKSIVKNLHNSIDLAGWDHRKIPPKRHGRGLDFTSIIECLCP